MRRLVIPGQFEHVESAAWSGRRSSCWKGTRPGRNCSTKRCVCIAPDVIRIEFDLPRYDLSLANRRATQNAVVHEAAAAVRESGLGLKAATTHARRRR